MRCNIRERVLDTLQRLTQSPDSLGIFSESFLARVPANSQFETTCFESSWSRFLELSLPDPYTPEKVVLALQSQVDPVLCAWVEAAVECCRRHDTEFCLALEEGVTDRFLVAAGILRGEGLLRGNH